MTGTEPIVVPMKVGTMRSPSTGVLGDSSSALSQNGRPGITLPRSASPVGGLRMAQDFLHQPVMVSDVVAQFADVPAGVVVDATVGGGGHAAALLEAHPHLAILGLDRDPEALAAARERLSAYGTRIALRHGRFARLRAEVDGARAAGGGQWPTAGEDAPERVSGVLIDLGVSSPQLDRPERGFSYRHPGPLDMRMDPTSGPTAADLVNTAEVGELADLFAANGEERLAGRIARAIVAARPILTTDDLAEVVANAVPAPGRRRGHPARRVFQALRIAVNEELEELASALEAALDLVAPGGRLVVISYHSGEDRLVKSTFARAATGGCTCPPGLPCVCGARPEHVLAFRGARRATPAEVTANHRAESARLRALIRLDQP